MTHPSTAVLLGIDAAWTDRNPSGMALLHGGASHPRLVRIARSFGEALRVTDSASLDWLAPAAVEPDVLPDVLTHWGPIDLAAVDMPLGRSRISSRRPADTALSSAYGARKAAVHSPGEERPGAVGRQLHAALEQAGLSLLTTDANAELVSPGPGRWFFETYPHAAIIELMGLSRRLPYKLARRAKIWSYAPPETRLRWVAVQLDVLRAGLDGVVEGVASVVPSAQELLGAAGRRRIAVLKGVEDALDAVVCAWVAHEVFCARCRAYGDADAAIIVPLPSVTAGRVAQPALA
jgi:predicted RNase H-like nuclease